MKDKKAVTMCNIEAYTLPSNFVVENDSHCFVVEANDKSVCWSNHGRGWDEHSNPKKVASGNAYREWLHEFIPTDNLDKCGVEFLVNGVCHTYANREMLICAENVDISAAAKNYIVVTVFGVYGFGLKELKNLLQISYYTIAEKYSFPEGTLDNVLTRVDDTIWKELAAWRLTAIEYAGIPVDEILAKSPEAGIKVAKERLSKVIEKREEIYENYKKEAGNPGELRTKIKEMLIYESKQYLIYLYEIGFISKSDFMTYYCNLASFLSKLFNRFTLQAEEFNRTGEIRMDLVDALQNRRNEQ